MDHDVFTHQMEDRFREEFAEALKALEEAPDGHWIDTSEMAFRDVALTPAREGLKLAVQAKVDAHPTAQAAAFSPPDPAIRDLPPARSKGDHPLLLDFYHLSEHIWDTAKCSLGETDEARKWAEDQLHEIKHVGPSGVLTAIAKLSKKVRSSRKKKRLRLLLDYVTQWWEMVDYRRALALGWDIGSGPTEAMCKNLTLRLKRTGMKRDPSNAAAVINLAALRESGQWDKWWTRSAA